MRGGGSNTSQQDLSRLWKQGFLPLFCILGSLLLVGGCAVFFLRKYCESPKHPDEGDKNSLLNNSQKGRCCGCC